MATRYYFPYNTAAANAPVTTFEIASQWDMAVPAGFQRNYLVTRKRLTPLSAENGANFVETVATAGNMIHKQYVSDPIANDQTISGTFTWVMRCGESNPGVDASLQCVIRVIAPDGTVRGVLYGGHSASLNAASGAVGQEFATTTQVRLMNGITLTPVDALAGDRLVVEIGNRYHNTTTATGNTYLHLGDSSAADHALGTNTQAAPGWIEFSADIGHNIDGDGTAPPETVGAVSAGIKVAKGTGTAPAETVSATSTGEPGDTLVYDWEMDGTDGTAVLTANSEFGTVTKPAGSAITWRQTGAWKGQYVEFDSGATATAPGVFGTMSPTKATLLGRSYFRYYALPTVDAQIVKLRGTGLAQRLTLRISTTGKLQLFNGATVLAESTNAVPTGQWVRLEYKYLTTTMSCQLFTDPRSDTPTWSSGSVAAVSDTISSPLIGIGNAVANWKVDFDHTTFDSTQMPPKIYRPIGTGTVSGAATGTSAGMKRAISAGWGIQGFLGSITSTGSKSAVEIHEGTGTVSGTSNLTSTGKKVAKGTPAAITSVASANAIIKKIAKGSATLNNVSTPAFLKADAESGTLTGFAATLNATATAAAAKNDAYGYRIDTTAAGGYLNWTVTDVEQNHGWVSVSAWVRVNSHAAGESTDLITVKNNNGVNHFDLFLTPDNKFKWDLLNTNYIETDPYALGTWHYIECRVFFGATTYTAQVRIDGVDQGTISSTSQVTTYVRSIWFGTTNAKTHQFDIDDIMARVADSDPGYLAPAVSGIGKKIARGTSSVTGTSGQTAGPGSKDVAGTGVVSALSVVAMQGTKVAKGGPALPLVAVTTTLGSSGFKSKVFVTGTITTAGLLSALGRKTAKGTATVSGVISTPNTGKKVAKGDGAVYDPFVLASIGGRNTNYAQGTGLVTGSTSASSTGKKVAKGTASLSGIWTLSKSTRKVAKGQVTITAVATGPTAGFGQKVGRGNVTVTGLVGAVGVGSKNAQAGQSIINGFIDATATGAKKVAGSAAVAGSGALTNTGQKDVRGTGLVSGVGSFTGSGAARQISVGNGQINATASLTAAPGKKYVGGSAVINHTAVFGNNGTKRGIGTAAYLGTGVLGGTTSKVARGAGAVAGEASQAVVGRKVGKGSLAISGAGMLSSGAGRHDRSGLGSITSAGLLASIGHKRNPRNPIRIGGKSGAVLVGSSLGVAIPIGGFTDD